jgi:hypothetical protein
MDPWVRLVAGEGLDDVVDIRDERRAAGIRCIYCSTLLRTAVNTELPHRRAGVMYRDAQFLELR